MRELSCPVRQIKRGWRRTDYSVVSKSSRAMPAGARELLGRIVLNTDLTRLLRRPFFLAE